MQPCCSEIFLMYMNVKEAPVMVNTAYYTYEAIELKAMALLHACFPSYAVGLAW